MANGLILKRLNAIHAVLGMFGNPGDIDTPNIHNAGVGGSSPPVATIYIKVLAYFIAGSFFFYRTWYTVWYTIFHFSPLLQVGPAVHNRSIVGSSTTELTISTIFII